MAWRHVATGFSALLVMLSLVGLVFRGPEDVIREPLRGLRTDAGKLAKLVDETGQRSREGARQSGAYPSSAADAASLTCPAA